MPVRLLRGTGSARDRACTQVVELPHRAVGSGSVGCGYEVTPRADGEVFVAWATVNNQLGSGWGRADEMTSTNGPVEPAGTLPVDKAASAERDVSQVIVAEHGEVVAVADVEPTDDQGVIRASLHAQAGHLPTGARTRLVDGVLDLPQTKDGNRLEATLPLGDAESLDRLRERCDEVQTRPAGASCLVDAALLTDADAPELDAATDRLD